MTKNFLRLYIKLSVIILAFILFLPIAKLSAHNPTKSPWLFINDIAVTEDMENPVPNPSKLDWGEHVFSEDLKKGGTLKASVDRSIIERDLKVEISNIKTSYKLTTPEGRNNEYNEDFSLVLNTTGNYFLDITLNKKDDDSEIISESIMIVVGDKEQPATFKVNGLDIDITSASPTYNVTDNYDLKFEVTSSGDYNYTWDLGTGETKDGTSIEFSFDKAKIPVYVVLRKQNKDSKVFVDSFVRIDSERENTFGIPRPPVKIPPAESTNNNFYAIGGLIVGAIVLLIIIYFLVYRKKK